MKYIFNRNGTYQIEVRKYNAVNIGKECKKMKKQSLTSGERETIISWNDDDDKIFIYTSQRKMMTKLQRNPQFELENEDRNEFYHGNPVAIRGYLPLNAITIRRTSKKGQKSKNFDIARFKKKRR